MADKVFLLTPQNVEVSAEERARLIEKGFFNQSVALGLRGPCASTVSTLQPMIGLIGAGNMARAMARGWGEPVLCTDSGSGSAQASRRRAGRRAWSASNRAWPSAPTWWCSATSRTTWIWSPMRSAIAPRSSSRYSAVSRPPCCRRRIRPPGVRSDAEHARRDPARASSCTRTVRPRLEAADAAVEAQVLELFGRLGKLVTVPERLMAAATAIVRRGPGVSGAAGRGAGRCGGAQGPRRAACLGARHRDDERQRGSDRGQGLRHTCGSARVTSPGGSTARGLEALEAAGVRQAFQDAIEAVVNPVGGR